MEAAVNGSFASAPVIDRVLAGMGCGILLMGAGVFVLLAFESRTHDAVHVVDLSGPYRTTFVSRPVAWLGFGALALGGVTSLGSMSLGIVLSLVKTRR